MRGGSSERTAARDGRGGRSTVAGSQSAGSEAVHDRVDTLKASECSAAHANALKATFRSTPAILRRWLSKASARDVSDAE